MSDIGDKALRENLKTIVKTLQLKGSTHSYTQMATSNFGIMSQIIFENTEDELHKKLQHWIHGQYETDVHDYYYFGDNTEKTNELGLWWSMNLKRHWPINGVPNDNGHYYRGFFFSLYKKGFSRNRILEIEYLDNDIVNEALKDYDWGEKEEIIYEDKIITSLDPIMVVNETEKWIPKGGLLGKLFGGEKKVTEKTKLFTGEHNIIETLEKVKVDSKTVKATKDFKNRNHVIAYYNKWIDLIDEYLIVKDEGFQEKFNKIVEKTRNK